MMRYKTMLCFAGFLGLPVLSTSAHAQEDDKGIYAVARAGMAVSPDQKLDSADLPSSATFDEKTKYKSGFTGELGGGYDFGMFRIEQSAGYMSLKAKGLNQDDFTGEGRNKAMFVQLGGYVDIPLSSMIEPYVGGGVGVARVDAQLSRSDSLLGTTSNYSGKDWGLLWHVDAGVGVKVAPKVTVELGARYTQVSSLKFDGVSGGQATTFEPTMRTISGTMGVRYKF
ncbi:porin family protein [Sphingobium sp. BYY-5]|uniref:outer membrane protein n=1 Tax=Sphingobium sp. BYY-5 TaxID=2926400 RepID=UPI001FA7FC89|nr:outer membrane beta-barrel protein [Sphingobium sp. BYY-5]MCI4588938.1 porin family protein [Sphingobium sp. BYY-5]